MNSIEDVNIELVDDPTPPEPDEALLACVIVRGRQRLARRRAIFGAITVWIAVVLIGGGVAVAQHRDSDPNVAVNPPTTVDRTAPVTERQADAHGFHYTLTLKTPVVQVFDKVVVTLRVENHTGHYADFDLCAVGRLVVYDVGAARPPASSYTCTTGGLTLAQEGAYTLTNVAGAPTFAGHYAVFVEPQTPDALPESLLAPLTLRVIDVPTISTTSNPHPGDFSGSVNTDALGKVPIGGTINVGLTIRNISGREIGPSLAQQHNRVALACTNDLSPDGHTNQKLRASEPPTNLFYVTDATVAAGKQTGVGPVRFVPTLADIGVVTCEGVIVSNADGRVTSVARLTNVAPVSFTVVPAPRGSDFANPSNMTGP